MIELIKPRVQEGSQKQVAYAIAKALNTVPSTETARFNRLLRQQPEAIAQLLSAERAERVITAICEELGLDKEKLIREAKENAKRTSSSSPDRHAAWLELGEATPWVDVVAGLPKGMGTLEEQISLLRPGDPLWLVGPAGSGKSARLWRAHQQKLGQLLEHTPENVKDGGVWLVDEPHDVGEWIAASMRSHARLVIATRDASHAPKRPHRLELGAWTNGEIKSFIDQLYEARGPGSEFLRGADLDRIAETLGADHRSWRPLDLGNVIRLLVDEPVLLDREEHDGELYIRSSLHQLIRRARLSAHHTELWNKHGRRTMSVAAAAAIKGSIDSRVTSSVTIAAMRDALQEISDIKVGAREGVPLRQLLERARGESSKSPLKILESWAQTPSSEDLISMLEELGAWQRNDDTLTCTLEEELTLTLAAEALEEPWMWRRLLDTLAVPGWSAARRRWAARLRCTHERLDELLSTSAAIHVGAIDLAVAMISLGDTMATSEHVLQITCSAALLRRRSATATFLFGFRVQHLEHLTRLASRRYRHVLPPLQLPFSAESWEQRATATMRRVIDAVDAWPDDFSDDPERPPWLRWATLLPWQALPLLQDRLIRQQLPMAIIPWESVILDYAKDGNPWAGAIAIGDVPDLEETVQLISFRGLLRALCNEPGPSDPQRHLAALSWTLHVSHYHAKAPSSRDRPRVVDAVVAFVRRHPGAKIEHAKWVPRFVEVWQEGFEKAGASEPLRAWFDQDLEAMMEAARLDPPFSCFPEAIQGDRIPLLLARAIERLASLGQSLYHLGSTSPLRDLFTTVSVHPELSPVARKIRREAVRALLQVRDAETLCGALASRHGEQDADTRAVLAEGHDEPVKLWIAKELGSEYAGILERIPARPEWRELASEWALETGRFPARRNAAARWLLDHPVPGECEQVQWLFDRLPVSHGSQLVQAGLSHSEPMVRQAAGRLLQRALDDNPGGDLAAITRCFDPYPAELHSAVSELMALGEYIGHVNASDEQLSTASVHHVIELTKRYLIGPIDQEALWSASHLCTSLATAARRAHLASLAAWIRDPLGEGSVPPVDRNRSNTVRTYIARGIFAGHLHSAPDVEPAVLHALAETEGSHYGVQAHLALLDKEAPSEERLLSEWAAASDPMLVGKKSLPPRWQAVQISLQRRSPRAYAYALTERLLALPAELRSFGIPEISTVATYDAAQAARLAPLFD